MLEDGIGLGLLGLTGPGREENLERRSPTLLRDRIDIASRLFDDAINRRKAKAGAVADRLGCEEGLEDLLHQLGRNAGAGVNHLDQHIITLGDVHEAVLAGRRRIRAGCFDGEIASAILINHGVARVGAKIGQRGLELTLVRFDARQVAAMDDIELDAFIDDVA